jgi:hypothetical protein
MSNVRVIENLTNNILLVTLQGAMARLWRSASTFLFKKRSASPSNMSVRFSRLRRIGGQYE